MRKSFLFLSNTGIENILLLYLSNIDSSDKVRDTIECKQKRKKCPDSCTDDLHFHNKSKYILGNWLGQEFKWVYSFVIYA